MQIRGRYLGLSLLLTVVITILAIACATEPTPEATQEPPVATEAPTPTEAAPAETETPTQEPAIAVETPTPTEEAPTPTATTGPTPTQETPTPTAATEPTPTQPATTGETPTPAPEVPVQIAGADVNIVATNFDFSVGEIVVPARQTISINLSNQGESQHNLFFHGLDELNAEDEEADRLAPGQSRTRGYTFDQPGLYPFYCPVGRHEDAGMIGVLRVEGPASEGGPTINIAAPTQTRELEGPEIMVGVVLTNFTLQEGAADTEINEPGVGHIDLSLDGETIGSTVSIVAALDNVSEGEHTLSASLRNNDGTPLSPPVEQSITFTVEAGSMPEGSPILGESPIAGKPTVSAVNTLSIILNAQNDSGQSGIATLTAQGDDTQVVLTLSEGAMESSAVHIHSGQCGPELDGVVHPLTNITDGSSNTLLEGVALASLLTGGFAINSHNADNPSIYTACGNIPTGTGTLTIPLNEQNESGQSGFATLTPEAMIWKWCLPSPKGPWSPARCTSTAGSAAPPWATLYTHSPISPMAPLPHCWKGSPWTAC